MNGVSMSDRVQHPRDDNGIDVRDGCILTGVFLQCRQ